MSITSTRARPTVISKDMRTAGFFLLPAAIGLIAFYIVPAVRGFYY